MFGYESILDFTLKNELKKFNILINPVIPRETETILYSDIMIVDPKLPYTPFGHFSKNG